MVKKPSFKDFFKNEYFIYEIKNNLDASGFIFLDMNNLLVQQTKYRINFKMLNNNYELHFIRQNLFLLNKNYLKKYEKLNYF